MLCHRAIARLSIDRTNAVTELRDFHGSPIHFRQRADDAFDHGGLTNVARMAAYHHELHNNNSNAAEPIPVLRGGTGYSSSSFSLAITERSSSVVTSPRTSPSVASSLSSRRIIFPLRVFGSASLKRISSGLASAPISLATHCRSSSFSAFD